MIDNEEIQFSDFLKSIGHKVYRVNNELWFDVTPGVLTTVNPCKILDKNNVKKSDILGKRGAIIRYSCKRGQGKTSFRLQIDNQEYSLTSLKSKARNQTKRGLKNCLVRELQFNELKKHGHAVFKDTLKRQGRKIPKSLEEKWNRYYSNASLFSNVDSWGAFYEGELAAFLIAWRIKGCSNIMILRSKQNFLKYYPNNALIYTYVKHALSNSNTHTVSIGLESLQQDMYSLDKFKEGMGFRKKEIDQLIEIRWIFNNRLLLKSLYVSTLLTRKFIKNEGLEKVFGLLKWWKYTHG